jgi:hypothetical protein
MPGISGITIVAEVGTRDPSGMGYALETAGRGPFSGTLDVSFPEVRSARIVAPSRK